MFKYSFLIILLTFQFGFSQEWLDQNCSVEAQVHAEDISNASERNLLKMIINQEGKLMVNDKDLSILNDTKLKEYLYAFIVNPDESEQWSKSPKKAYISLKHYNHAEEFERVEQNIREVYYFLWNTYAQEKYEDDYVNLDCKKRAKVQKQYPYHIYLPKKSKKEDKDKPQFSGPPPFEADVIDN